jgi:hypothetical protein
VVLLLILIWTIKKVTHTKEPSILPILSQLKPSQRSPYMAHISVAGSSSCILSSMRNGKERKRRGKLAFIVPLLGPLEMEFEFGRREQQQLAKAGLLQ